MFPKVGRSVSVVASFTILCPRSQIHPPQTGPKIPAALHFKNLISKSDDNIAGDHNSSTAAGMYCYHVCVKIILQSQATFSYCISSGSKA